jgi:hypothetical protein
MQTLVMNPPSHNDRLICTRCGSHDPRHFYLDDDDNIVCCDDCPDSHIWTFNYGHCVLCKITGFQAHDKPFCKARQH